MGSLLQQGLSEPELCGDLVCRLRKIVSRADFSGRFGRVIVRCRRVGCSMGVMQQSACSAVDPVTIDGFAFPLDWTPVGRASDSVMGRHGVFEIFKLVGTGLSLVCSWSFGVWLVGFFCSGVLEVSHPGVLWMSQCNSVESISLARHGPYS